MKPYIHAKNSARKFGGQPEDYVDIHNFFDETKAHHATMKHRSILHNSFGIFLAERLYGFPYKKLSKMAKKFNWSQEEQEAIIELIAASRQNGSTNIINSDGNYVSVRDVGEQHILEDMGRIPSISDYLKDMPLYPWLGGPVKKIKKIPYNIVD